MLVKPSGGHGTILAKDSGDEIPSVDHEGRVPRVLDPGGGRQANVNVVVRLG
jgi:hypothetical protein